MSKDKVDLYREDGLMAIKGNGQEAERVRKKIFTLFRQEGLSISGGKNPYMDFLDVTPNLEDGSFKPVSEPNEDIKHVSKLSKHPPQVLNNILESINRWLSAISCNEDEFDHAQDEKDEKHVRDANYDYQL